MKKDPRPKLRLATGSFLISNTWTTIISSQTFLRKKGPKDLKQRRAYCGRNNWFPEKLHFSKIRYTTNKFLGSGFAKVRLAFHDVYHIQLTYN